MKPKTTQPKKHLPQLLIMGGQQRSGTSMLWDVCNTHPAIQLTFEFRNFSRLGQPYDVYMERVRKKWWGWHLLGKNHHRLRTVNKAKNALFVARYYLYMRRFRGQIIEIDHVREALGALFPNTPIVGDKFPAYIRQLDMFAPMEHLHRVIIYRDCRDVVPSTLKKVAGEWKSMDFAANLDTPTKIAERWVNSINIMHKHADTIHIIRYEELVTEPAKVLRHLGDYLGVDPTGFDASIVRPTSIGKHESALSAAQMAEIMAVAEPTLRQLGYI